VDTVDRSRHKSAELFGHPKGLFVLFLTEMWERFSFYGMKALLIFYLVKYHLFTDTAGNHVVGSYAALVYAMPVVGGYLADKYLGFRKAVLFGGVLLVLGHIGMAYEGHSAVRQADGTITQDTSALSIFYLSLSLIVLGVGFLKANISSIVGELYGKEDPRKDSGFTIFYMGINLGSFLATILCGTLGERYGWGYGFGAAGVGMLLGLLTFIQGTHLFEGKGESKVPDQLKKSVLGPINLEWTIYILSVVTLPVIWYFLQHHSLVEWMLIVASIASLAFIIYQLSIVDKVARDRLIALTILIILSVVFWALFEQSYTSLNLFADRSIERNLGSFELTSSSFLALNALFIILFAPVFAGIWTTLDKKNKQPNTAIKFGLAIVLVALGFGILVWGGKGAEAGKVGPIWLVLAYLLLSFGELCLSPVGLSSVTKLSPTKIVGFMMGVWFLATAAAEYVAALLANLASVSTTDGEVTDVVAATQGYLDLFYKLFVTGSIIGILVLLSSPLIKKLMHGIK
jgi:proton-dependent oligopeptide transporter, POT family